MEIITHVLEQKGDGTKIVKTFFLYPNDGNLMAKAHSHFTRHERKIAKLNHKHNQTEWN
jgi:hypothetical protein